MISGHSHTCTKQEQLFTFSFLHIWCESSFDWLKINLYKCCFNKEINESSVGYWTIYGINTSLFTLIHFNNISIRSEKNQRLVFGKLLLNFHNRSICVGYCHIICSRFTHDLWWWSVCIMYMKLESKGWSFLLTCIEYAFFQASICSAWTRHLRRSSSMISWALTRSLGTFNCRKKRECHKRYVSQK